MKTKTKPPRPGTVPDGPADGGSDGPLSARMEAAAALLAGGSTLAAAAKRLGCGTTTLKRWKRECPAFAARITELRADATAAALGRLVTDMSAAAAMLGHLSREGEAEQIRLTASRTVIELATKLRESTELADRISALEAGRPGGKL